MYVITVYLKNCIQHQIAKYQINIKILKIILCTVQFISKFQTYYNYRFIVIIQVLSELFKSMNHFHKNGIRILFYFLGFCQCEILTLISINHEIVHKGNFVLRKHFKYPFSFFLTFFHVTFINFSIFNPTFATVATSL